jgi:TetR/AcrR family transcriptional regulator, transcriptional repressor for nem operon
MRMTPENKDKARAALVDAAGKLFREQGVAATGIDAIARETGQTSGAFYAHFPSKADVFRDAVEAGFTRLIGGIRRSGEAGRGTRWASLFAQAYLSPARRDAVGQGCLLPTLANDAARSVKATHRLFGDLLTEAASELAKGCGADDAERDTDRALAVLALCAGGLMLARAIPDAAASDRMLMACREAAETLVAD